MSDVSSDVCSSDRHMSAGAGGRDHPAASLCHTVSAHRSRWMTFLEVAAHVPRLRRHARLLGTAAADDLVQATLVEARARMRTGRCLSDAGLREWLFAILHEILDARVRPGDADGCAAAGPGEAAHPRAAAGREEIGRAPV